MAASQRSRSDGDVERVCDDGSVLPDLRGDEVLIHVAAIVVRPPDGAAAVVGPMDVTRADRDPVWLVRAGDEAGGDIAAAEAGFADPVAAATGSDRPVEAGRVRGKPGWVAEAGDEVRLRMGVIDLRAPDRALSSLVQ